MFRGTNTINLDDKGRIAIPTKYREELQECCERQLIVTMALNEQCNGERGCLWLYPIPEWEKIEQKIIKLPTANKMAGKLRRFLIGSAFECEMDAQGRLMLPEKLRKFASLDKKVVLIGQLNKFEIWNEEAWKVKEEEFFGGGDDDNDDADREVIESLSF